MSRPATSRQVSGTSLVEAVVALAVMAFGMLAVIGIQATLRLNGDVAKQRAEATRIAQEAMETARAFSSIGAAAGQRAYEDIASNDEGIEVADYRTNTTYRLSQQVQTRTAPDRKEIRVRVDWTDRNGTAQRVELNGLVGANDPRVALALHAEPAGIPTRQPLSRHSAIPPRAVTIPGTGKSAFLPPGSTSGFVWLFDDQSGSVSHICYPASAVDLSLLVPATDCFEQPSYLISGFIRFSPGASPDGIHPAGLQIPVGVQAVAVGVEFADGICYADPVQDPPLTHTAYYCRVRQSADTTWTGRVLLKSPLDLNVHDVCRYTTSTGDANADHPALYTHLASSLGNQNFLVVDEGIACPTGTVAHQPPL